MSLGGGISSSLFWFKVGMRFFVKVLSRLSTV